MKRVLIAVCPSSHRVQSPRGPRAQAGEAAGIAGCAGESSRMQADQTISVEVNLVNILFTVADRKGKFVTNLKKEDFKVFEDERIQSVTNFSSENNLPLTIALLVDTSGSIRDKLRFEEEAAIEFFYSTFNAEKTKRS